MKWFYAFLMLLGRICIAAIFFTSGLNKFTNFDSNITYVASKGLPFPSIMLTMAGILEIIGALSVIFGIRAKIGAIILLITLIPATILFHDFWNIADSTQRTMQMIHFFKNISIFGGLLYIICCGAGKFGFDCNHCHQHFADQCPACGGEIKDTVHPHK